MDISETKTDRFELAIVVVPTMAGPFRPNGLLIRVIRRSGRSEKNPHVFIRKKRENVCTMGKRPGDEGRHNASENSIAFLVPFLFYKDIPMFGIVVIILIPFCYFNRCCDRGIEGI